MIKIYAAFVALMLGVCALVAGCDRAAGRGGFAFGGGHAHRQDPFTSTMIADGAAALERKLGAPVQALSVEISPYRITYSVQDPVKPDNVDAYELKNGLLLGPTPVQLSGNGSLGKNLFPLSDVALNHLPEFVVSAAAAVHIDDAKADSILIRREFSVIPPQARAFMPKEDFSDDGAVRVTLYLSGARRRGYVVAAEDLQIKKARQL